MPVNARAIETKLSRPISFRIPEIQLDVLESIARREGVFLTSILREAVEGYLRSRIAPDAEGRP